MIKDYRPGLDEARAMDQLNEVDELTIAKEQSMLDALEAEKK